MNRHIPNGSYGGVGGREFAALSYPILVSSVGFDKSNPPLTPSLKHFDYIS